MKYVGIVAGNHSEYNRSIDELSAKAATIKRNGNNYVIDGTAYFYVRELSDLYGLRGYDLMFYGTFELRPDIGRIKTRLNMDKQFEQHQQRNLGVKNGSKQ